MDLENWQLNNELIDARCILLTCSMCVGPGAPQVSLEDRNWAKDKKGVFFNSHKGGFQGKLIVDVVMPAEPMKIHKLAIPVTRGHYIKPQSVAHLVDCAWLYLTDGKPAGRCLAENGVQRLGWKQACNHHGLVQKLKNEVLAYDQAYHLFMVTDAGLAMFSKTYVPQEVKQLPEKPLPSFCAAGSGVEGLAVGNQQAQPKHYSLSDLKQKLLKENGNMFISAPAGFGKTHLIPDLVQVCKQRYGYQDNRVMVTASTGLTAQAIEGQTVHSAASLQRGQGLAQVLVDRMSKAGLQRLKALRVLLIDEVSILSDRFFDLLDEVLQIVKKSTQPFAGVRLICLGDFAQLPSISYFEDKNGKVRQRASKYAFESRSWQRAGFERLMLSSCWRYDINSRLGRFLQTLQLSNKVTTPLRSTLSELFNQKIVGEDRATHLTCTRAHARDLSLAKLRQLDGEEQFYQRIDRRRRMRHVCELREELVDRKDNESVYYDEKKRPRSLFSSLASPAILRVKVGASVIATSNIGDVVKTGCMGKVAYFQCVEDAVFDDELTERDLPYGVTVDDVKDDFSAVHKGHRWPVVDFYESSDADAEVIATVPVLPALSNVEDKNGAVLCSGLQVPLVLGYAMTVHRSQGLTLNAVVFHAKDLFKI